MASQTWEEEKKRRRLERARSYSNRPLPRATGTGSSPATSRVVVAVQRQPAPAARVTRQQRTFTNTRRNQTPPTYRYRFGDSKLAQPPSDPRRDAELGNAQFRSRERRMDRERQAWENSFQDRATQEVVGTALPSQAARWRFLGAVGWRYSRVAGGWQGLWPFWRRQAGCSETFREGLQRVVKCGDG